MTDLQTLYQRAGFITGIMLDHTSVSGMLSASDRLHQEAADMIRSDGDFNLEALGGGFHGQGSDGVSTLPAVLRKVSNVVTHSAAADAISKRADLQRLAATLTKAGVGGVALAHSILWCKPPGVGSPKPPHQDAAYLDNDPDRYVTFWIALDHCDRDNGCLQVVPGSHQQDYFHSGAEPQVAPEVWDCLPVMDVPLNSGWAAVFHPRLLHASAANISSRPRRALMLRYVAR